MTHLEKIHNCQVFSAFMNILRFIRYHLSMKSLKNLIPFVNITFHLRNKAEQSIDSMLHELWVLLFDLRPNTPLIQLWCARSKLNMDEIFSLKIHVWYVDIPQKVFFKSLHVHCRSFLLLNLPFYAKVLISTK